MGEDVLASSGGKFWEERNAKDGENGKKGFKTGDKRSENGSKTGKTDGARRRRSHAHSSVLQRAPLGLGIVLWRWLPRAALRGLRRFCLPWAILGCPVGATGSISSRRRGLRTLDAPLR